jgi:hypothetical protein
MLLTFEIEIFRAPDATALLEPTCFKAMPLVYHATKVYM